MISPADLQWVARGADVDTVDLVDFEIHHGRVTEITVYQSDAYGFDEFWS